MVRGAAKWIVIVAFKLPKEKESAEIVANAFTAVDRLTSERWYVSRHGHANLAFKMSRVDAPLSAEKTIELGHHILKAHIYKNVSKQRGYSSRDMQVLAHWLRCISSFWGRAAC